MRINLNSVISRIKKSLTLLCLYPLLNRAHHWVQGMACFMLSLGLVIVASHYGCLVYSHTDSLPYHYFIRANRLVPGRDHYTCVSCPWHGGSLIKKIVGMAGDVVTYDFEGNLWIRRHLMVGKPKKKAGDGRTLTPLPPGVIPEGQVFIAGEHERSLDSRYQEVGLIPEKALQGRAFPLV
jgi:conjugal transfer pilin signal peptidase TrbI